MIWIMIQIQEFLKDFYHCVIGWIYGFWW